MTTSGYAHIDFKPSGTPRIENTRINVEHVVTAFLREGRAEQVQEHYPDLSLGEVYSALAYYYDHKDVMDRQSERDDRGFLQARKRWRQENPDIVARLEQARARRA